MRHRYTREKFLEAIYILGASTAPIEERLLSAYFSALIHLTDPDVIALGDDLSRRVSTLLTELRELAENGLLSVDRAEAERLAEELMRLDEEVAHKFHEDDLGMPDD